MQQAILCTMAGHLGVQVTMMAALLYDAESRLQAAPASVAAQQMGETQRVVGKAEQASYFGLEVRGRGLDSNKSAV